MPRACRGARSCLKPRACRGELAEGHGVVGGYQDCYTGNMNKWNVYIARCSDDSLYTGIAIDVEERIKRHNVGQGAKYTRTRLPIVLVWVELMESESSARRREAQIKKWSRIKKESLVKYGDPVAHLVN
jgi:putative endonuclease